MVALLWQKMTFLGRSDFWEIADSDTRVYGASWPEAMLGSSTPTWENMLRVKIAAGLSSFWRRYSQCRTLLRDKDGRFIIKYSKIFCKVPWIILWSLLFESDNFGPCTFKKDGFGSLRELFLIQIWSLNFWKMWLLVPEGFGELWGFWKWSSQTQNDMRSGPLVLEWVVIRHLALGSNCQKFH